MERTKRRVFWDGTTAQVWSEHPYEPVEDPTLEEIAEVAKQFHDWHDGQGRAFGAWLNEALRNAIGIQPADDPDA